MNLNHAGFLNWGKIKKRAIRADSHLNIWITLDPSIFDDAVEHPAFGAQEF